MLEVKILAPGGFLFTGKADHVILPGEQGVFEVLPFHRPLLTRLLAGVIRVDGKSLPIERGAVRVERNTVTAVVNPA